MTPGVRDTIAAMWDLMEKANGVGLAAPQAGLSQRIIVVDTREPGERYALVNPEITWKSEETSPLSEGCLSIPGVEGEVIRPSQIRIRGIDPEGREVEIEANQLLAKVFQHEVDHVNGILFIDHLSEKDMKRVEPDLERFEAPALSK